MRGPSVTPELCPASFPERRLSTLRKLQYFEDEKNIHEVVSTVAFWFLREYYRSLVWTSRLPFAEFSDLKPDEHGRRTTVRITS